MKFQTKINEAFDLYDEEEMMQLLENQKADPSYQNNYIIRRICSLGWIKTLEILLKDQRVDPTDCKNEAIRLAASNNNIEIVKILLKDQELILLIMKMKQLN